MNKHIKDTGLWVAGGLRTPFVKIDDAFATQDAIELSVPVVQAMLKTDDEPIQADLAVWGTVAPNLGYSNIAREVIIDSGVDQSIPAYSTVMACSTSMAAVFDAAGMLQRQGPELALAGGVESMSRVQLGLNQSLSDWLRRFFQARSMGQRLESFTELQFRDIKLHIPSVTNRSTGMSMGEHTEIMAKEWEISRSSQDELALLSHERAIAAKKNGFFDSLLTTTENVTSDKIPRADSTIQRLAKLSPVFDKTTGKGTLTAGNSSPLTDGAAGIWVASNEGLSRLPSDLPRAQLLDWEIAGVDISTEGLLMAPAYAIPRMLARHSLKYEDIDLWEIHEAFAAQVLSNVKALESTEFLKERVGVNATLGEFPWERLNPNGGSLALGHPFGATGARIMSQAAKELAIMPSGSLSVVSVCADGGLGTVALLRSP